MFQKYLCDLSINSYCAEYMSLYSFSRFLSSSIHHQALKFPTFHFSTAAPSSTEKFYNHLQKSSPNVERILSTVNAKLDSRCVNEVLHKCYHSHPQMGIRFFIWAGCQSDYRHSAYIYSEVCRLFEIKRKPQVVFNVFDSYVKEKCVISVKMFKVALNLFREARLANEALWVLRKMTEFGLRPDTTAYNTVIRLFCEPGDMDMAQKLMGEMGLIDLYPDMITYASMIKGFCDVGRLKDASGLFKVMKGHGCPPNVVAYSALLDGVCRFGSMDRALELLAQMEKEGGDCSPNVVTYTSVMQSFCEKGKAIEALGVLDRMAASGCAPNRVTVTTLVKGLCVEGHVEEAYKLIDKVVAGGGVSYGECYSSLVLSLVMIKRLEEAEKLFRKILASGLKPDSLACSILIKELCLDGRLIDGFHLYEAEEKAGLFSFIDSDTYSILLIGLCKQNHMLEAAYLVRSMLERGIRLRVSDLNQISEHLKKFGDKELITQLAGIVK
ncbi:pentatricopeptide repeat-containing protein [Tripterygium wilfordii]|uniref:Pentatricopeptide repeat-containing protein n=1 Tax=Tripterygium wilfordii TaxID=458696 RepID=A0A7J7CHT3_TRIWF|nr:pentatricopeptide repeat-containing protein At5g47360 [Tripterygium wilfordii]KAF5733625.1 pentatricopeptide repeat-containing protein [Tripterygium wilfordii]